VPGPRAPVPFHGAAVLIHARLRGGVLKVLAILPTSTFVSKFAA
jgi:hypothetical protein